MSQHHGSPSKSVWNPVSIVTIWLVMVAILLLTPARPATANDRLSLAGSWRFHLDAKNEGLQKKWYAHALPTPASGPAEVALPGTTDEAKAGLPNPRKPSLDGLYRPNQYTGVAWYQREVEIPADWKGKLATLLLERVHWVSDAWLDGKALGTQDSLIAPHEHEIYDALTPGRHVLTLRVDNTIKFNLGSFPSIFYEGTQTNWNGVVGLIELRAHDPVWIAAQRVYPKLDGRLRVEVDIRSETLGPIFGELAVTVRERGSGKVVGHRSSNARYARDKTPEGRPNLIAQVTKTLRLTLDAPPQPWSEFNPALYVVESRLEVEGRPARTDQAATTFGFREMAVRGTQFTLNDRPLKLRGTLECGIFPRTGYPPCDVASWRRIYRIEKSYGLNFIRFHSWCPPEAAFAAADLEGVMIQAEGPQANIYDGSDPALDAFLEAEFQRMVDVYGDHPSFCLMTLGNEHGGKDAVLSGWIDMLKRRDPRHQYATSSGGQTTANRQYMESGPRGIHGPSTNADFRGEVVHEGRPLMGHEIGQWTFYPNFDEIAKYTGVLQAKNFEMVREDLRAKGMLDLAPRFFQATGMHAVLLYKEEIEVLLRTPGHAGFSLLDLHDYPGQGTALIGLLDPFWDAKGFIAPEVHKQYCGDTVPLARLTKRSFTTDETLEAAVDVAHFGPQDLSSLQVMAQWDLCDRAGHSVASGKLTARNLPTGELTSLGTIRTALAACPAPCKLTLRVTLDGTTACNSWDIWVYPADPAPQVPAGVIVSRQWDESTAAALAAGKRVVLFPKKLSSAKSLPGSFLPVFWSPVWFHGNPDTMGILCDPQHPLLAQFPTEFYSNWQWYELLQGSKTMILDETPADFRPVVQVVDNFARNHKLGNVLEARVGDGRLLVCTLNVNPQGETRPVAKQFLKSLYAYAASDRFQPPKQLAPAAVESLFGQPPNKSVLARLRAKVLEVDSEDADHGNLAAYAIDGDADTFWHTHWGDRSDPMPHHLVIDLGRVLSLKAVTYLPRQDMSSGRVRDLEIYAAVKPQAWGAAVAKATCRDSAALQTLPFPQPVRARYLKVLVRSAVGHQPHAAIAELDVVPSGP